MVIELAVGKVDKADRPADMFVAVGLFDKTVELIVFGPRYNNSMIVNL